jgi:hypothetical protein
MAVDPRRRNPDVPGAPRPSSRTLGKPMPTISNTSPPAPTDDTLGATAAAAADRAVDSAEGVADDLAARVFDGLHAAVDRLAGKVAPLIDGAKRRYDDAGQLPGERTDATRTMIRERPIAAVAGAALIGAALLYLLSGSSRDAD